MQCFRPISYFKVLHKYFVLHKYYLKVPHKYYLKVLHKLSLMQGSALHKAELQSPGIFQNSMLWTSYDA